MRERGYLPLAEYALLSDCRSAALSAIDGSIDWWATPNLDSEPVFSGLLDPQEGGHFVVAPTGPFSASRQYLGHGNVLQTRFRTERGEVRLTEALNLGTFGPLPWNEMVRRVDGISGAVPMCWDLKPGRQFGRAVPEVERKGELLLVELGELALSLRFADAGRLRVEERRVSGEFTTSPGSSSVLSITATAGEPLFLPRPDTTARRLLDTERSWERWSRNIEYQGAWREAVLRSAAVLRSLTMQQNGAIAAAATTSLPEVLGGSKNWDYRFSWVRDSSFALESLVRLGLHEEVQAAICWLINSVRPGAPRVHVCYELNGRVPEQVVELDAPGYRDSRPVMLGNRASSQSQLGVYGDFIDTVYRYIRHGHVLDRATAEMIESIADHCSEIWQEKDSGMWELTDKQHYTISKMGCWVALDRCVQLANEEQLSPKPAERWRQARDDVRDWIRRECWSEAKSAYTFYAGTEDLDAAVLLAGRTGFDRGEGLAGTVEAVERELAEGAHVYRYSSVKGKEGTFLACSFWLVDALVRLGRLDAAKSNMDELLKVSNDVGIFTEQYDPRTGNLLGNLPQALTHLALINSAGAYSDAISRRREL